MPTSLEKEKAEQCKWPLRRSLGAIDWFDKLVESEFLSQDQHLSRQSEVLRAIIRFASRHVPYYCELFQRYGINAKAIREPADLPVIPTLTKELLKENHSALKARSLPQGHVGNCYTISSGSTGEPVRVEHTQFVNIMFALMKQREMRWFRFDPRGVLALIRYMSAEGESGNEKSRAKTRFKVAWPNVGNYFETGPAHFCNVASPLDFQLQWLDSLNPDYLTTESGNLECLALGYQDRHPPSALKGIMTIANLLTKSMRRRTEEAFRIPIHQDYGLNEIGIVASRCPEGGRYHVHNELCLVEIVDKEGRACSPGDTGRLLVTGLTNYAMPLFRYDTDDLVEAVEGQCPCGRTLPSFGIVAGRYRRNASLPPNTYAYWLELVSALDTMPADYMRYLRQYQFHQYRDERYELRLVTAGTPPVQFNEYINKSWQAATAPSLVPLDIVYVDRILPGPGNKVHNFTSDYAALPDQEIFK